MSSEREKLYDIIDDIRIAMMTTIEAGGALSTQPMANLKADRAGIVWFFTEKDGAAARNIDERGKVSLAYAGSGEYVAVSGTGSVVDDRAKIDALWTDFMSAWFPEGKDDPNLVLLRIDLETGEYWTYPSAPLSMAVGYVKAKLTGERADDIGDNKKMAL